MQQAEDGLIVESSEVREWADTADVLIVGFGMGWRLRGDRSARGRRFGNCN